MLLQEGPEVVDRLFAGQVPHPLELFGQVLEFCLKKVEVGLVHLWHTGVAIDVVEGAVVGGGVVVLVLGILRVELHVQVINLVFQVKVLLVVQVLADVDVLLDLLLQLAHLDLQSQVLVVEV